MKIKWEAYDPDWLVQLAKEEIPEELLIIENLKKCTSCFKESKAYYYFVESKNPNHPNDNWQFDRNVMLHSKKKGIIILDILKEDQIGGIEFLSRL